MYTVFIYFPFFSCLQVIELEEIEKLSSLSPCLNRLMIFKEAFLKLKITIFKNNVIESRKRAKGLLRPKFKLTFNDIAHVSFKIF